MKTFLGGTCNGDTWRDELIKMLRIDYFNPVVENWTPACQAEEIVQRETCDYCLYVITAKMTGVYSIAEVVEDSNKRPEKTLLCILEAGFTEHQLKSLAMVKNLVAANGAKCFKSLETVAIFLNS